MTFDRKPLADVTIAVFPFEPVAPPVTVNKLPARRRRPRLPAPDASDPRLPVVATFLASERLKPNSRKAYQRELYRFLVWTDQDWDSLTTADLALYKDDRKAMQSEQGEASVNSINVALTALKSFFAWYCAQPLAGGQPARVNPTTGLRFERVPLPPPQDLSATAIEWLHTALAYTDETQLRDRALVQILSHGLRASELVSLDVGHYDGQRLHIERTKTHEPRTVPLSKLGRAAIDGYLMARAEAGAVLTPERPLVHSYSPRHERLSYQGVYKVVKRLGTLAAQLCLEDWLSQQRDVSQDVSTAVRSLSAESLLRLSTSLPSGVWSVASELINLHPHQLRHTYATGLFRQGLDPTHARRLLGHSAEQTTRRYTQAVEAEAAERAFYRLIGEAE